MPFTQRDDCPVVPTSCGPVRGVREDHILAFRGIPYAAPPVGADRRFRPPLPPTSWDGVHDASLYGPAAPQPTTLDFNPQQSEDCLTLNIWTPGTSVPGRPVLFCIHGGGFTSGSGSAPALNGQTFAANGDIVVVTVNYRLGALGFLDLSAVLGADYASSGNTGLLDLIAALRWVQANIAAFGGDPSRITVMGHSAGAKSIGGLLVSPLADGLFHRAIAMSGAVQSIRDQATSAQLTEQFLHTLGLTAASADRLLELPAATLMAAQQAWMRDVRGLHFFGPVIDGHVVTESPLEALVRQGASHRPLLIGTASHEAYGFIAGEAALNPPSEEVLRTLFGQGAAAVQAAYEQRSGRRCGESAPDMDVWQSVLTDAFYRSAALRTAEAYSLADGPVWLYRFGAAAPQDAGHGSEQPYVWHRGFPAERAPLAQAMHRAWIRFIHTGDLGETPEAAGWPRFESERRVVRLFDDTDTYVGEKDWAEAAAFPIQALTLG
ncbi:carboxylesterase/lipase family protein [Paenibacillus ferrarius]|uniref:carboxylesterase/lipase family protein n=1 Tax=Paenibacillus ferrarius TaxID=1469647 RepID=UPI003D2B3D1A